MKKTASLFAFILLAAVAVAGNINETGLLYKSSTVSENGIKGKFIITPGLGFNLSGTALRIQYQSSTYWDDHGLNSITGNAAPMLVAAVDYGIGRRFSAGLSFGSQTVRLDVQDSMGYNGGLGLTYTDVWHRYHFAARGDYYIIAKDKISLYTGLKIGYNIYTLKSTRDALFPTYTQELNVNPSPASVQAHIGFSYFFHSLVGFNAELGLGIGGPYIFALGATLKL